MGGGDGKVDTQILITHSLKIIGSLHTRKSRVLEFLVIQKAPNMWLRSLC